MNEETELNICDVLCSWDKVNLNDGLILNKSTNPESKDCLLDSENLDSLVVMDSGEILVNDKKTQKDNETTFVCSICYKELASRNSLRVHLKIHSGNKRYCCEHCGKLFSHNATLVGHLTKFHNINGETPLKCSVCDKIFCRKNALKIHMATHVGFKPFLCKICSKAFSQKITRDIHTLTHTGKYDYSCSECSRKFPTRYKLNYHMKSHDLPEYHCLLCMKQFTNKEDLDAHCDSHNTTSDSVENNDQYKNTNLQDDSFTNSLNHSVPAYEANNKSTNAKAKTLPTKVPPIIKKKILCNFCGCSFVERRSLLHHIKMRHAVGTAVRHNCFMCQKSFTQKSKLIFHMKRHTELPNFRCETCGKRYYRKDSLEKHNKIHEKTLTSCTICEKKLKTENDLQKHILLHTSLDYTCLQCGKTFTTKSAQKYHIDMHKGNFQKWRKPFYNWFERSEFS